MAACVPVLDLPVGYKRKLSFNEDTARYSQSNVQRVEHEEFCFTSEVKHEEDTSLIQQELVRDPSSLAHAANYLELSDIQTVKGQLHVADTLMDFSSFDETTFIFIDNNVINLDDDDNDEDEVYIVINLEGDDDEANSVLQQSITTAQTIHLTEEVKESSLKGFLASVFFMYSAIVSGRGLSACDVAESAQTGLVGNKDRTQQTDSGTALQPFLNRIPISAIPGIQNSPVLALKTGDSVRDAIHLLFEKNVCGAPIADSDSGGFSEPFIGFIDFATVLLWCLEECEKEENRSRDTGKEEVGNYGFFARLEQHPQIGQTKIGELAKSFLWDSYFPVHIDETLFHVLLLLSKHRLHVVPVIERTNSQLTGFISQDWQWTSCCACIWRSKHSRSSTYSVEKPKSCSCRHQ
uniref:uncharacterized protein LOC101297988 n=1 Tax=Fragaria vesca subsp. vesca TaxID=101020 RepID=UPI0005C8FAC6|nr:PREDICTED: uncharacterized protein LOC101297988 [Fragaria vesca subsp. vesca]